MYQGKYTAKPAPKAALNAGRKRKASRGTVLFYSIYAAFVVLALCAIFLLLTPLRNWLQTYQASQPENKSQEIFTQLFENPDWTALYAKAGVEDTLYEGSAAYRAYMEEKVGQDKLTFMKTAAGLSGDRKYVVRHGDEKIATFTMTGTEDAATHITTWELNKVELLFKREHTVRVETAADQTVYINAVALDSSHTIKYTDTLAEEYLPEGAHGYRTQLLQLDGLLTIPQVTVKNADGSDAQVTLNENGVYTTSFSLPQITDEEQQIAIEAAKAQALYAIRAVDRSKLRQHFDSNSQIYKDICATEVFMQDYTAHWFDDSATTVSDFYRYSDDLFSAHVSLKLNVTRTNGTVKVYNAASTFFFVRQEDGRFLVNNMTNLRIQEPRAQVRLLCMAEDAVSMMVNADSRQLTLPAVQAPEGKTLRGWAKQETDEEGRSVLTIVFIPDANGCVLLPDSQLLEPMTLYPVFE